MWRWSSLITLLVALPATGQLTIGDAVRRAMEANPRVASSHLDASATRQRATSAGARRWGSVDAIASWNSYDANRLLLPISLSLFANPALGMQQLPWATEQMHYGVAVQLPILDAGKITESSRSARASAAGAEDSALQTEDDIALSVRTTFRNALALKHALAAADAHVAALDRDLQDADLRLGVGSWAPLDAEKVRFAAAGRAGILAQLRATEALLGSLMGERVPEGGYVLAEESADEDPPSGATARHDLLAAKKLADAASHRELQAKKEFGPEVGAAFLFQQHRASGIRAMDTHDFTLSIRLPLFDGGARLSALRDARDARLAAQERVRAKELEIAAQTADAEAKVEAARAQLEAGTAQRKLGSEVARVEKLKLDQGVGRIEDYLTARANELRGETAYWQALYAVRNARDYQDYVAGRRLAHE